MDKDLVSFSKFLSFVLRHHPEEIGLVLDDAGWVAIDELLQKADVKKPGLSRELLLKIVEQNDKKRFAISEDGLRIRASQGHSIDVDLGLEPKTPPATLYHGTASRFLESIQEHGLVASGRHHVHLSPNYETALSVGQRYGKPVILLIQSGRMADDGFVFYKSDNGVWLTEHVPVVYFEQLISSD